MTLKLICLWYPSSIANMILKVVSFNDFRQGYSSTKGNIPVMKDDRLNCATEKKVDVQALVPIECIDDKEIKDWYIMLFIYERSIVV